MSKRKNYFQIHKNKRAKKMPPKLPNINDMYRCSKELDRLLNELKINRYEKR